MGEIRTALSRNFKELIAFPSQPRDTTGSWGRNLQWFPRGHLSRFVEVRIVSMRVAVSVLRANGWPRVIAALAAMRCILRSSGSAAVVAAAVSALLVEPVRAETLPDALVRTTLRTWTIGLTVSQTLFNGFKTANTVRQSEAQVLSGREALRNTGQGVLLDAVTAYTNVLANQSLVEAQRINVTFLRETLATTKTRLEGGDVTPTDVAQA